MTLWMLKNLIWNMCNKQKLTNVETEKMVASEVNDSESTF